MSDALRTSDPSMDRSKPGAGSGAGTTTGEMTSGDMKEKAAAVSSDVQEQATKVAVDVKDQARHLLSRTQEEVSNQAASRADELSSWLRTVVDELRAMARADEDSEGRHLVGLTNGVADRAEHFANQLDERGVSGVVDQLKATARRRPGMVLAGAALSGFVVGRIIRDASKAASHGDANHGNGNEIGSTSAARAMPIDPGLAIDPTLDPAIEPISTGTDATGTPSAPIRTGMGMSGGG